MSYTSALPCIRIWLDGLLSQAKLFTFMSTQPVAIYASKGRNGRRWNIVWKRERNTFSSRCAEQDKNALCGGLNKMRFCWLRTIMNTRINLLRERVLKAK